MKTIFDYSQSIPTFRPRKAKPKHQYFDFICIRCQKVFSILLNPVEIYVLHKLIATPFHTHCHHCKTEHTIFFVRDRRKARFVDYKAHMDFSYDPEIDEIDESEFKQRFDTIEGKVFNLLLTMPNVRGNDNELVLYYWLRVDGIKPQRYLGDWKKLTALESITRTRRKIQALAKKTIAEGNGVPSDFKVLPSKLIMELRADEEEKYRMTMRED